MDNNRTNKGKDREAINRTASTTGAEQRLNKTSEKEGRKEKDKVDARRAELNGKEGKFETEHTQPTGEGSGLPGAEEKEVGTAAAGAGLGGNKGTGTSSKKNLD